MSEDGDKARPRMLEERTIPEGTIVHIQGLPFSVVGKAKLMGPNWGLVQEPLHKSPFFQNSADA